MDTDFYDQMAAYERTDELFDELNEDHQTKLAEVDQFEAQMTEQMHFLFTSAPRPTAGWDRICDHYRKHPTKKRPKEGRSSHSIFSLNYTDWDELKHNVPGAGTSSQWPSSILLALTM